MSDLDAVFAKTRELSDSVMECDIYKKMKSAEDAAMRNESAAALIVRYEAYDEKVKHMLANDERDFALLKKLNDEMSDIKDEMAMIDELVALSDARGEFSALMQQINAMLKFLLIDDTAQDDPLSKCGGCKGCYRAG